MISAIACVDSNWGIGYQGELLAHIPEDMKFFKELTKNHVVVMGRKTWDSLPNKPLKDRLNLVISSQSREVLGEMSIRISLEEAKIRLTHLDEDEEWFIIGGEAIYKELLPYYDKIYITKILHSYDKVDTYFPNIENIPEWEIESASEVKEYNDIKYQFYTYKKERRKQ